MKVVAFMDEKRVLAELTPDDLAGMAALSKHSIEAKLPKGAMPHGDKFKPEIVGAVIEPASMFKDAADALNTHKEALSAAKHLKAAASRFQGFFKED